MSTLWRAPTTLAASVGAAPAAISVVVPTYRRANRLALFLERLARVERAALLDVLIVDQTPGAEHGDLNGFSRFFAALRFLKLDVANVALARNAGALEARADMLLFVDDDMELEACFASNLLALAASASRAAFGGTWENVGESRGDGDALAPKQSANGPLPPCGGGRGRGVAQASQNAGRCEDSDRSAQPPSLTLPHKGGGDSSTHSVVANFLPSGVLAIRRDDFLAVGGFDERLHRYFEDAELSHRLKKSGILLVKDVRLRAIHHDEKTDGTWYSPSLREAASTLARQQAYFTRKTGRSWPRTVWTLARTVVNEARNPAYVRKGNVVTRAIMLTLMAPSALCYAARQPALRSSAPRLQRAGGILGR